MATSLRASLVLRRATVATCDRAPHDPDLRSGHAVAVDGQRVAWIGPDAELERSVDLAGARVIDADGRLVSPGLVDSHTHLVFGDDGSRAAEFAALSAGQTYAAIARAGGGIRATMRATREAPDADVAPTPPAHGRAASSPGASPPSR